MSDKGSDTTDGKSIISDELQRIINLFSESDNYSALKITEKILKNYDQIPGKKEILNQLKKDTSKSGKKRPTEWINEVKNCYDYHVVKEICIPEFLLGMNLVDESLRHVFSRNYLINLRAKVFERIGSDHGPLFTDKGLQLMALVFPSGDVTNLHRDAATSVDELGREPFALAIAERLKLIRLKNQQSGRNKHSDDIMSKAFFININGTWGSGKSSLLELIKKKLTSSKWIVEYYNAWQQQRIHPSWWALMDIVYKKCVSELRTSLGRRLFRSFAIQCREISWRFRIRNLSAFLIILAIILALIGVFFVFNGQFSSKNCQNLHNPTQIFRCLTIPTSYDPTKGGAGAISFIIALFTGIFGLRQSLISGSKDAAEDFVGQTSDPMEKFSNHFESLINWIKDPVIIFIDDLDRCTGEYTVEFLEGVQTLFRKPNVIIMIAADRRWIRTSYEKIYNTFNTTDEEQLSPLGYRFLDKIFQLSITVPSMTKEQQKDFLKKLIIKKTSTTNEKIPKKSFNISVKKVLEKVLENLKVIKKTSTTNEKIPIEHGGKNDLEEQLKNLNSPEAESEAKEFYEGNR